MLFSARTRLPGLPRRKLEHLDNASRAQKGDQMRSIGTRATLTFLRHVARPARGSVSAEDRDVAGPPCGKSAHGVATAR